MLSNKGLWRIVKPVFPLFQTHYHTLQYPKTKEKKIWTKDKIEPQHIHRPNSNKRAIKLEPSPTNNHVLERPTNCDARGSILCATKLWRHSKWRWKDERPADRTKKHGSAFACVHRTPTRSQVAQEIRKRSSFVERNKKLEGSVTWQRKK